MTIAEVVGHALASWPGLMLRPDGLSVPTHCLYPSNSIVHVHVAGGAESFQLTDMGGALNEFESTGSTTYNDVAIIRSIAKGHGLLTTDKGIIHTGVVSAEQLIGGIVLVANASKEAAHALELRTKPVPRKNFREMLARLIDGERSQGRIIEVARQRMVVGASTKAHRFDYDISLSRQKRLLLDAVVPEATSINSVLAANLDVKAADLPGVVQRIVYDDQDGWRSADLALLGLGAVVVPFGKLRPVIERLAA